MSPTIYVAGSSRDLPRARAAMALATDLGFRIALDWTHSVEANGSDESLPDDIAIACTDADLEAACTADVLWVLIGGPVSFGAHGELTARIRERGRTGIVISGSGPAHMFHAGCVRVESDEGARPILLGHLLTLKPKATTCLACRHCFMEPDDDFCCGHPDAGPAGTYIRRAAAEGGHCGAGLSKFEQHPNRDPDGSLRSQTKRSA